MINFSDISKPKEIDCGNGKILIYQPTDEQANDIIDLQESYYKENKSEIPKHVLYKNIIPMLTNLNLDIEDELEYQKLLSNPPVWLKLVIDEVESIIVNVDKIKAEQIRLQIQQLDALVSQIGNVIEIPDNVKDFFELNKNALEKIGGEELINSAKELNIIR